MTKKESKKADFEKPHRCINCGTITDFAICHVCSRLSVKLKKEKK